MVTRVLQEKERDPLLNGQFTSAEFPLLVFFDGHCIMCNGWVNRVMADNPEKDIRFGPKQGSTFPLAAERFPEVAKVDSIVVIEHQPGGSDKAYVRSRAVYRILRHMKGQAAIRLLLTITPTFLADIGYRFVSKIRYYIFGRSEFCRMPKAEERPRFVD